MANFSIPTVYFDWFALEPLQESPVYAQLRTLLEHPDLGVVVPHTTTHIEAWHRNASERSNEQLAYFSSLSRSLLLIWKDERIGYRHQSMDHYIDPTSLLFPSTIKADALFEALTPEQAEKAGASAAYFQLQQFAQRLKNKPFEQILTPEESDFFQQYWPGFTDSPSTWKLLTQRFPIYSAILRVYPLYRAVQRILKEDGLLENDVDWNVDTPLNLDHILALKGCAMESVAYINQVIARSAIKHQLYNFLVLTYLTIDLLTSNYPERLSFDELFILSLEAEHTFYASFTQFFVVENPALAQRAQLLYKTAESSTRVVTLKTLEEYLSDL